MSAPEFDDQIHDTLNYRKTVEINRLKNLFFCKKTNNFISLHYVCDGNNDCGDFQDETNCSSSSFPSISYYFFCLNTGEKIGLNLVCDFYKDCSDGSDETFCSK